MVKVAAHATEVVQIHPPHEALTPVGAFTLRLDPRSPPPTEDRASVVCLDTGRGGRYTDAMIKHPVIKFTDSGVTVEGEVTNSGLFAVIQRMAETRAARDARFPSTPPTEHAIIASILGECLSYLSDEVYEDRHQPTEPPK